ncbi:MAG: hypothetical protein ACRDBP_13415 [Luteolibacter sp.]
MFRLTALLCLLAATLAHAQPAGGGKLKVRFLAERAPAEIGPVMLVAKEAKSAPFELPVSYLSAPQTPPQRVFALWSTAKNVSLTEIALPEKGNSFIVLLFPANEGGYKHVIISDNNPEFKPGDIYFYNQADKTVMGFVGSAKFTLDPAKGTILRPTSPSGDGAYYDVGLGVREKEGDKPLSIARWPVQKGIRMYVFFYINPRSGKLDFRAVDEFVEPEASPD